MPLDDLLFMVFLNIHGQRGGPDSNVKVTATG